MLRRVLGLAFAWLMVMVLGQYSVADVDGDGSDGDEWEAEDGRDDAAADDNGDGHDVDGDVDDVHDDDDDDCHVELVLLKLTWRRLQSEAVS